MIINILKYGVSEGLAKIAPFIISLYIAKLLTPEIFGLYSLIAVVFEIVFIIISFNIQATTRIDYFKEPQDRFNLIKQNHFVISLFFVFLGFFSIIFLDKENRLIMCAMIIVALIRSASVFILAILQCAKKVNQYVFANITFIFTLAISTFIFVNLGASYLSWLYGMVLASSIQFLTLLKLYGEKFFTLYRPRQISFNTLKLSFVPAALFMPQAVGWWLKSGADRAIISEVLGDSLLGQYALAFQFSSLLLVLVTVISLAFVPELNRLLTEDNKVKAKELTKFVTLFICLSVFCVIAFGYACINYFYLNKYPLSLSFFYLITVSMFPQALMLVNINVLYFSGEGKFVAKLIFISFLFQALINILVAQLYGVVGMIACSALINVIVLALVVNKVNKTLS